MKELAQIPYLVLAVFLIYLAITVDRVCNPLGVTSVYYWLGWIATGVLFTGGLELYARKCR
jgi:hypothetical protein